METPRLNVTIKIEPLQSEIPLAELNAMFAGEIADFEKWFLDRQRQAGGLEPTPLITAEHAILRGFMYYLYTKQE